MAPSTFFPRIASNALAPYTFFIVLLSLLLGGGARQGLWSDAVLQLAALPLLGIALLMVVPSQLNRSGRWAIGLVSAIVMLPLCQLIPLPPAIWAALPGRAEIASAYQVAGMTTPWLPISLDPASTWRGLMSLLPAVAVSLAMLSLGARTRRLVVGAILVVVFISVGLDLLQMMDDDAGTWRFYAITNPDRAVGFFANANHNAAMLYCAVPFILAWAIGLLRDRRPLRGLGLTLLSLLIVAVIIGLTVTRSRAGIALLGVAGLACIFLAWRHDRGQTNGRLLPFVLGANLIAGLIAFQFGFVNIMQRVEQSEVIEDIRWSVAKVTTEAALAHMPLGSGFGTFVPVYDRFAPRTLLMDRYVNHAHNDWLELWLTGGVPAIVLVLCFLGWFAAVSASAWRENPGNGAVLEVALARAACIVICLLMLHSLIDYPLRTAALDVLFAICCALLMPLRDAARAEDLPAADRPADKTKTGVIRDARYA